MWCPRRIKLFESICINQLNCIYREIDFYIWKIKFQSTYDTLCCNANHIFSLQPALYYEIPIHGHCWSPHTERFARHNVYRCRIRSAANVSSFSLWSKNNSRLILKQYLRYYRFILRFIRPNENVILLKMICNQMKFLCKIFKNCSLISLYLPLTQR